MKKLLFSLAALVALASCKKENNVNPPDPHDQPAAAKRLTNYTWSYNNQTAYENYAYDAQGRLTTVTRKLDFDEFDYSQSNMIVVTTKNISDNSIKYHNECNLDATGRIVKQTNYNLANVKTGIFEYVYNADGTISKRKYINLGANAYVSEYECTYENGNQVLEKYYKNGILETTTERKFDLNKPNRDPWGLFGNWPSEKWYGKGCKNVVKEFIGKKPDGSIIGHTIFSYEFDADGYPVKVIEVYPITGGNRVAFYSYE